MVSVPESEHPRRPRSNTARRRGWTAGSLAFLVVGVHGGRTPRRCLVDLTSPVEVEPGTKQVRAVVGSASLIDARVHGGALIHAGDVAVAMAKVICLTKCVNGVNLPVLG